MGQLVKRLRSIWIPQIIASLMLLWALNPDNPYQYYTLLRWVCCGVFAYLAFRLGEFQERGWAWTYGVAALVYNPLFPVHLTRGIWSIVNVATVVIIAASIIGYRRWCHSESDGGGEK
jgi:hypothetical protein